jgi:SAM-dependent methyltransferase
LTTLRETFDEAPGLYDRVRPGYPEELFDDLERLAGLRPGSRVLELGCGTGQATAQPFDAVFAATSFHWIDPAVRVAKSADALRPGGALAVVSTHHVAGGDEQFFVDVQRCYERWDPDTSRGSRLLAAADIRSDREELEASGRFRRTTFRRYERELTYSSQQYRDLLLTYSGHRAMEPNTQQELLSCMVGLIDERYGGKVAKRYMNELAVAVIIPPPA